jgi:hypothetical protein
MWHLLQVGSIPSLPPHIQLKQFNLHFSSSEHLLPLRDASTIIPPTMVIIIHASQSAQPGCHAKDATMAEQQVIDVITLQCARYGVVEWSPNLCDSAYLLYNSAMCLVAIDSFRQCLTSKAYACFGANPHHAQDMGTIIKFYDHFVHYVQQTRFQLNAKAPGSVHDAEEHKNAANWQIKVNVSYPSCQVTLLISNISCGISVWTLPRSLGCLCTSSSSFRTHMPTWMKSLMRQLETTRCCSSPDNTRG